MQDSYHFTNFGKFGKELQHIADQDGYVHTTAEGWANANLDWGQDEIDEENDSLEEIAEKREYINEVCNTRASETRAALERANETLGEWQEQNA